ncbi:MAG: hypothetical protein V3V33_16485 [Candidatus Lokiarchaeia archaeon]
MSKEFDKFLNSVGNEPKSKKTSEEIKKEIVELLKDLMYWDTCPQRYKDRIPTMIKALNQNKDD